MESRCIFPQRRDLQGPAGEGSWVGLQPQHLIGVPHTLYRAHLALVSLKQEPERVEPGSKHTRCGQAETPERTGLRTAVHGVWEGLATQSTVTPQWRTCHGLQPLPYSPQCVLVTRDILPPALVSP